MLSVNFRGRVWISMLDKELPTPHPLHSSCVWSFVYHISSTLCGQQPIQFEYSSVIFVYVMRIAGQTTCQLSSHQPCPRLAVVSAFVDPNAAAEERSL